MNQLALAILVAASLGASAIHFALGPHHVEELGALGLGFYLAGIVQVVVSAALIVARRRTGHAIRSIVVAGIGVNVGIVAAWAVSRIVGLPAGPEPWTPEAIGVADSVSVALQVVVIAMGVVLIRRGQASSDPVSDRGRRIQLLALGPAVALIAVATSVALLSPEGVAGRGRDGHSHGPTDALGAADADSVQADESESHSH